jgi:hypothetical protein
MSFTSFFTDESHRCHDEIVEIQVFFLILLNFGRIRIRIWIYCIPLTYGFGNTGDQMFF